MASQSESTLGSLHCYTLEVYDKTPIFIPVDITEDVVGFSWGKFQGVRSLEVQTRNLYKGGF